MRNGDEARKKPVKGTAAALDDVSSARFDCPHTTERPLTTQLYRDAAIGDGFSDEWYDGGGGGGGIGPGITYPWV